MLIITQFILLNYYSYLKLSERQRYRSFLLNVQQLRRLILRAFTVRGEPCGRAWAGTCPLPQALGGGGGHWVAPPLWCLLILFYFLFKIFLIISEFFEFSRDFVKFEKFLKVFYDNFKKFSLSWSIFMFTRMCFNSIRYFSRFKKSIIFKLNWITCKILKKFYILIIFSNIFI